MRRRGFVIALTILAALVVAVLLFGGRLEQWLLRMHGIR